MSEGKENSLGSGDAIYTPASWQGRAQVRVSSCDKMVPPATDKIIGQCIYYYRPVHPEIVEKSGVTTWEAVKAWLTAWDPWDDQDVVRRLLQNRDVLIQPSSDSPLWSRGMNFMMRHIGCGHQLPKYYVGYGYYYCSNYGEKLYPRLTAKGKTWLVDARRNLQKNMELGLAQNMMGDVILIPCRFNKRRGFRIQAKRLELELNGEDFKAFAFKTHVPAYLDGGLADLPPDDLLRIGGQPNTEEWLDGATWEQAIDSGADVGRHKLNQPRQTIKESGEALVRVIQGLLAEMQ
ncbi:hypothetical protein [Cupriavidus malaysiensis]|uniref:Uncharacterized protein n=1 Tax=Cupriavidus malaysiensis TaxID=367825 RepID=A0ABM6F4I8_9BURK|nr:hypothetical protein [Cupriavidus malaysiensis]AOZ06169.1 hypothetical protein BKK80_10230 [Cupriavidus malaysiensis]